MANLLMRSGLNLKCNFACLEVLRDRQIWRSQIRCRATVSDRYIILRDASGLTTFTIIQLLR